MKNKRHQPEKQGVPGRWSIGTELNGKKGIGTQTASSPEMSGKGLHLESDQGRDAGVSIRPSQIIQNIEQQVGKQGKPGKWSFGSGPNENPICSPSGIHFKKVITKY